MSANKGFLSGCAFLLLLGTASAISLMHLRQTLSAVETPTAQNILKGEWPRQFEEAFRKAIPISTQNRNLWGRIEYALFQEGRKGVVVGAQDWLFSDEEFSCPAHHARSLSDNLSYAANVHRMLAEMNTRLMVVLIPAKVRVLPEYLGKNRLPGCRTNLYADIRTFLTGNKVPVTDLLPAMLASTARESLYLKTDTHWSPHGARLAAQNAAQQTRTTFMDIELPKNRFSSQAGGTKAVTGDLTSYLPGVAFPDDRFTSYLSGTAVASAKVEQSLFGDTTPAVALVGTSYSANQNWNFEGFLKESLKTDVLNMANEGQGPFVVMDKYLQSGAWKDTPPRLVVWEIPERYMLMPHGVSGPAQSSTHH
jgi:alginate O-acetyltransferase complex protein AlgJ